MTRSGFDGPWTNSNLEFNNEYFTNLMNMDWEVRKWDGPTQYEDVATRSLMMLPTDIALKTDPAFSVHARKYADDEALFLEDFKSAYARLLALNTPPSCSDFSKPEKDASHMFR